ncbi:hypothetical protein D3C78_1389060 [compost metagenome]
MSIAGRIPLVGPQLVEVVVAGRLLQRGQGQPLRPGRGLVLDGLGGGGRGRGLAGEEIEQTGLDREGQAGGAQPQSLEDEATILIDGFRGDIPLGGVKRVRVLDKHEKLPGL